MTAAAVSVQTARPQSLIASQLRALAIFGALSLCLLALKVWTWNGSYSDFAFWRWPYRYSDFDQICMAG